jgi:bacterial/archaeal transporter family protein
MPRWIAWTLLTLVSWGIWAILFRLIDEQLSPAHSQALSTLGVLPVLVSLALVRDSPSAGHHWRGVGLAFGSGIVSCLGNIACYEALNHAKAATIIPLTALYPVVTVLLAVPLLKERLNLWQWIGIALSLSAIYLFINAPAESDFVANWKTKELLLPLAAIVLWGVTGLMQKAATNHISARTTAIWFLAAFVPVAVAILANDPIDTGVAPSAWALSIALGFTLALGNFTLMQAFACGGKASIIAPLAGLYPLVSIPIALVGFHERLNWREASGIALALAAVVLLSLQSDTDTVAPATLDTDVSL